MENDFLLNQSMNKESKPEPKKFVEIVAFNAVDQTSKVLARAVFEDGAMHFEGEPEVIASLKKGFIGADGQLITPEEGVVFLEAIGQEYRSPYLYATEIKEEE